VKPVSKVTSQGFLQVGVEPYGGGLWHTWFDRDLSVAGRVILREESGLTQHFVHITRPILRIPNLAIHLDRSVKEGFKFNDQTHLLPILASATKARLEKSSSSPSSSTSSSTSSADNKAHHSLLLNLLANELNTTEDSIVDFELSLTDTQPAVIGGALNEWIFSPRLDNLLSSWMSIHSLIKSFSNEGVVEKESRVSLAALFDNEEVGSQSERGAASTMIHSFIHLVTNSFLSVKPTHTEIALRKSFLVSADMAHACHPNYSEKHEPNHRPELNKGLVIKENANQRYATTSVTGAVIRTIAANNNIPLQDFVVRNDSLCGSTIGPILSAFGIRTIDVGTPQFSMHSIRETCAVEDIEHSVNLFTAFYQQVTEIDEKFIID